MLVIGFIFDAMLEVSLVRTGLYIYSQAIPFGTLFAGEHLPVPADLGVAVGDLRDDPGGHPRLPRRHGEVGGGEARREGQAVPEEAGARHVPGDVRDHQRAYFAYGGWFWAIKASGLATSVACPWPYPEAKVYDPQGYYEENGAEGPYSVGKWSTWQQGLPGRPARRRAARRPAR